MAVHSEHRNILGHMTQTATWVICDKCGTGFIGDDTLRTCFRCISKHRSYVSENALDVWDWIAISIIPAFFTLFLFLNDSSVLFWPF